MKKSIRNILLLASATPLLISCASQSDVDELSYQLRIVNKKLEDMKSTTVGQLQKRQAAASGQMDGLEQDILKLKSQLEESYHLNQRLREQNKELEESIMSVAQREEVKRAEVLSRLEQQEQEKEARLAELNEKLQLQQQSVKAIQEARIKEAERRAKEAALAAKLAQSRSKAVASSSSRSGSVQKIRATKKKVKKSVVAPPVNPTRTAKAPTTSSTQTSKSIKPPTSATQAPQSNVAASPSMGNKAEEQFKSATRFYQKNNFRDAYPLFEQVANNSTSSKSVEARYMMGECLYKKKEYDKAIMQYQKIISQHSGHSKAPAAMLKQAMSFEKLSDKDTAKVIYKKLLKKHGSSPEAQTAQEKLGKL